MTVTNLEKIVRKENKTEQRLKSLEAIEEISNTCSSLYTSDLVLNFNKILKPFCKLTGADYGIVFLVKDPNQQLWAEALYGLPEEYKEVRNKQQILSLNSRNIKDNWPSVRAILRKQLVLIKDVEVMKVGFSDYFINTIKPNRIISVAAVPIIINMKAVGAITKYYARPHVFSEEEISFMRTTSNIITNNIEKNHLLELTKKSETDLAQANLVLKEVNQELDSFVYIASHDLREPLRTIEGFISVLQNEFQSRLDPEQENYFLRIVNAVKRMRKLIEDLTILARESRDLKQSEVVNLKEVIEETEFELTAFLQQKRATIEVEHKMPLVNGNKEKIISVFKNLIINGIKFNKSDDPCVRISWEKNEKISEDQICICIEDNGIGIEEQFHKKIFGLFQRLHSIDEYEGTGAGLAIVKKILDKYGCKIRVQSSLGRGSKFFFTLLKAQNNE